MIARGYICVEPNYYDAMTHQITARGALRAATHEQHDRVDRLYSQIRLDDRDDYGAFLGAQAAAHIPVEQALVEAGVGAIVPDWDIRQRGDLVRADLAVLGLPVPDPAGPIVFSDEAAVLGGLYVLGGRGWAGRCSGDWSPPTSRRAFLAASIRPRGAACSRCSTCGSILV